MDLADVQVDNHLPTTLPAKGAISPSFIGPGVIIEANRSPALITTMRTASTTCPLVPTVVPQRGDPWTKIISTLSSCNGGDPPGRPLGKSETRQYRANKKGVKAGCASNEPSRESLGMNVHVSFVERFGAKTVSLTWHDSTEACYGEQPWMLKVARSAGRCALTGMAVNRGDMIYSPASRAAIRPLNRMRMILSSALENLESQDHVRMELAEVTVSKPPA
jgi:hypothetical protein